MRALLTFVVLAAGLAGQRRVFTVDASNGPGTDFTDLPPALAQGQHGDVYRVRPGLYSPFATSLGVALLGEPGAIVGSATATFGNSVDVSGVPAGQTFALRGFEVRHADPFVRGIQLNGVADAHIEDVTVTYTGSAGPNASIYSQGCSVVTLTRCRCDVYVLLANTGAWLTDCDLRGYDETPPLAARTALYRNVGLPGLTIAGGTFRGGRGSNGPPGPGIWLELNHAFFVTGDATTSFFGGSGGAGAPAIMLSDATLNLDPRVVLVPSGSAPPIQEWRPGTVRVVSRPLAYLSTSAAPLGGALTGTLSAGPGDMFLLAASLVSNPLSVFGMTSLVDVNRHVGLGTGVMTGTTASFTVPVPNNPELRGATFAFQAGVFPAGSLQLGLSNPAIAVVR